MIQSLFFAVAEAETASPGLAEKFGLEPQYVAIQAISFLILFGVIYYFAIKPIVATLDNRREKIESGLKYAEEMKAKLEQAQQESAAIAKKAQVEAAKFIEEARKAAKEFSDREQKAAADRANEAIAKAQQAIELEKKKMLADARVEIARLVVSTTQRVLAKELSDSDRARYNESASRELTGVQ